MDNRDKVLSELVGLINKGKGIKNSTTMSLKTPVCDGGAFNGWKSNILTTLNYFKLQKTEHYLAVAAIKCVGHVYPSVVEFVIKQLEGLKEQIEKGFISLNPIESTSSLSDLENIFNKFTRVVRQLRSRHDNRETLTIKDEYDVQDLLHALLVLHFDDVRAEEWTPSYAGGCERMDFLLKDLQTVIEVKKTRSSMSKKELGEELIIDIEKYKVHPDCKQLYCFIYDPDGYLGNSSAIKNDLEKNHQGFVKIFIRPEV